MHADQNKHCSCPHHFIIPFIVFVVGVVFLLKNLGYFFTDNMLGIIWPSLIALAGVQLMISRRCGCYSDHGHCNHCHHCMHDGSGNPIQK